MLFLAINLAHSIANTKNLTFEHGHWLVIFFAFIKKKYMYVYVYDNCNYILQNVLFYPKSDFFFVVLSPISYGIYIFNGFC